jgi:hypothetical protein
MILKPETEAVMEPREIAARAFVEMCPIDTIDATTRVYSSRWVLKASQTEATRQEYTSLPKNRKGISGEDGEFLFDHLEVAFVINGGVRVNPFFNPRHWRHRSEERGSLGGESVFQ